MSLPKPYYEEKGIQIYCGDCRTILPHLPQFDLVLTDPPYNCGKDYGVHNDAMSDDEYFQFAKTVTQLCMARAENQFWVAPRYKLEMWMSLLPKSHLCVIRRGASGPFRGGWADQFEIALAIGKPSRVFPDLWEDVRLKGEGYFFREETYGHPGYTPSRIMQRAVDLLSVKSVVDPFCGTGTTLEACKLLGRTAVGIELNPDYCDIAIERLRQGVLITV